MLEDRHLIAFLMNFMDKSLIITAFFAYSKEEKWRYADG